MNKIPPRMIIYARDVQNITGRSRKTSQSLLRKIRQHYNKCANDVVTILEFCSFMKMELEMVKAYL